MNSSWKKYKLLEFAEINPQENIKKGQLAKKIAMEKIIPYCKQIPSYEISKFNGGTKFKNGDTIMARITPCLENGKISKVTVLEDEEIGFGSTEYIVFRAIENISDSDFLYYLITSPLVKEPAIKSMVGSSGRQRVQIDVVKNLELDIPPLDIQQKIAKVLSAIDDKIKLNNSVNNNLEQQIFTIFDNIFPNVRDGENTISNYFSPKRGKNLLSKNAILGDVPVIAGGLNPATYHNVANTNAPVITISASGANAGFVKLWHIPVWSSDSSYIDNTITSNIYFWYVMLKKRQQEIFDSQTGSAQPHIYPQHIEGMTVSDIDMNLVNDFNDNVTPLFIDMGENIKENQKLIQLRDTILPKLMSGEIDVSEVDISTDKLLFSEDK